LNLNTYQYYLVMWFTLQEKGDIYMNTTYINFARAPDNTKVDSK